ncbi:hypothetical protein JCM10213v2_008197 [Rhodosporidiobolus nylandii]
MDESAAGHVQPDHTTIQVARTPPGDEGDGRERGGEPANGVLEGVQERREHEQGAEETIRGYSTDTYSSAHTATPILPHRTSSSSSTFSFQPSAAPSAGPLSPTPRNSQLYSSDSSNASDASLPSPGVAGPHHGAADPRLRWDDTWSEEDDEDESLQEVYERQQRGEETARERRERRRRERRVYGGGRHRHGEDEDELEGGEEGTGDMGVGEVGGLVLAGSLSPTPLLLPLACARLGPALFVPLLALAAALGWLSAVVVGGQGRYVGARNFPALASAVFPHRFKLHLVGELLASIYVLLGSVVRTTLGVVAAAEVAVDLLVPERRRRDWERVLAVLGVCGVWLLVPLLLPPLLRLLQLSDFFSPSAPAPSARYTRLSSTSTADLPTSYSPAPGGPSSSSSPEQRTRPRWTVLLSLPAYSIAFVTWPLALLILGVRLKRLNHDAASPAALALPSTSPLFGVDDVTGFLWPSILLTFSALLTAGHETFFYFTSLARPSSTSTARQRRAHQRGLSLTAASADSGGETQGQREAREGKRNQYPLAVALGMGLSFLIHLGWGLVGALSLYPPAAASSSPEVPLPAGDVLSDPRLPRSDGWLGVVRVLVLAGTLGQLSSSASLGIGRARRGLAWAVPSARPSAPTWRRIAARVLVWTAVALLSWLVVAVPKVGREGAGGKKEVGGHGAGLGYLAMWAAVVLGGLGSCLGPALAYLTLFHLRPPRTIFTSSPSSPHFSSDALLQRKERQMQRRLSGRRVWTDVGVFGALGPVGVVLVGRGIWALVYGGS